MLSEMENRAVTKWQTLRITSQRSIEWNTPVDVNFIEFEKAFDNVDRKLLEFNGTLRNPPQIHKQHQGHVSGHALWSTGDRLRDQDMP